MDHETCIYFIGRLGRFDRLEPNGLGADLVRPQYDHWRPRVQFHEPQTMQDDFSAVFSAIESIKTSPNAAGVDPGCGFVAPRPTCGPSAARNAERRKSASAAGAFELRKQRRIGVVAIALICAPWGEVRKSTVGDNPMRRNAAGLESA
jgi:hypothetical protein